MSERTERFDEKSVPQLVSTLFDQVSDMIRKEFKLARIELGEKVDQARKGAALTGSGGALAVSAFTITLFAIGLLLATAMEDWVAFLVVGVVSLVIAYLLVTSGAKKMNASNLELERTKRNLEADRAVIKEHTS